MSDFSEEGGDEEMGEDINEEKDIEDIAIGDISSEGEIPENKEEKKAAQPKMDIEQNEKDKSVATYTFFNEDHTLGNSLRYILSKKSEVQFVGYSIPHPSENKLNLRLQTTGKNSNEVLFEGLNTLSSLCDILESKFLSALKKFEGKEDEDKLKKKRK